MQTYLLWSIYYVTLNLICNFADIASCPLSIDNNWSVDSVIAFLHVIHNKTLTHSWPFIDCAIWQFYRQWCNNTTICKQSERFITAHTVHSLVIMLSQITVNVNYVIMCLHYYVTRGIIYTWDSVLYSAKELCIMWICDRTNIVVMLLAIVYVSTVVGQYVCILSISLHIGLPNYYMYIMRSQFVICWTFIWHPRVGAVSWSPTNQHVIVFFNVFYSPVHIPVLYRCMTDVRPFQYFGLYNY